MNYRSVAVAVGRSGARKSRAKHWSTWALLVFVLSFVTSVAAGTAPAGASTRARGGQLTYATFWASLDPASPLFSGSISAPGAMIYDQLFYSVTAGVLYNKKQPALTPGLATGYAYSDNLKHLDIYLRHGVKFQDGTPFNAAAVEFNIHRDETTTNQSTPFLTDITSITTKGNYTVVLRLSHSDGNLINTFGEYTDAYMVSPTSLASMGASQFAITPVGAGPFKVTSDNVGVSMTLAAWPGYWDAKHRYLSQVTLNGSVAVAGDTVEYADLESGAVQGFYDGSSSSPQVLEGASSNPNITTVKDAGFGFGYLQLNTVAAPFNNLLAREAIDYCTDRSSITQNIFGGLRQPVYVLSAPAVQYFPKGGSKASSFPYPFNESKGTGIVQQLGGLKFTMLTPTSGIGLLLDEALSQEWEQCGMTVKLQPESNTNLQQLRTTGEYQILEGANGGWKNPYVEVQPLSEPSSSFDIDGVNNATLTNLIDATDYTINQTVLAKLWARVYAQEDVLAVNIPLFSAVTYYFRSPEVHGLSFTSNTTFFNHAWVS